MKRLAAIVAALSLTTLSASIAAQDDPHAADRELFRQYLATVEAALNEGDIGKVKPLLRDDVVVTFVNAEVTRGVDAIGEYYEKVLTGSNALLSGYQTRAEVSAPARFFGDTAIADGTSIDTYTFPTGDSMEVDTKWNVTLVREDDVWKVAQLNFSVNPFDNPILGAVQGQLVTFSVVALLVGLVIGVVGGRISKKRA